MILLSFLLSFLFAVLSCGLSWIITCGLIKLITLCFGLTFSWVVASGIWLLFMSIKVFSK